jgi:hypothetical protein
MASAARRALAAGFTVVATIVAVGVAGTVTPAVAGSSNTLSVKASEYVYLIKGSPKAGWVTIDFRDVGSESHMMAVVRLKKGVTVAQLKAAALSQDDSAFAKIAQGDGSVFGMPEVLGPGSHTTTIAKLAAGHYGMLCFVPAPDGSPHMAHGMIKVFDVSTSKSSAQPPSAGVGDVTLTDSSITAPSTGIQRTSTVKVTNQGTAPHTFSIVRIQPGYTLQQAKDYFDKFFNDPKSVTGPAPGVLAGGVSDVAPGGGVAYVQLDLTAGHYAYVSTDGEAPADDYSKGMHGEFDVR